MRALFAVAVMLAASAAAIAAPTDLDTARARAEACVEIAKATGKAPCDSAERLRAEAKANAAIDAAIAEKSAPARPAPKIAPAIANPVAGATYELRGNDWVMIAPPPTSPLLQLAPPPCPNGKCPNIR